MKTPSLSGFIAALAILVSAAPLARSQITLNVTDPKAERVTVQSADITTEVTGRLAVTTFDLVFANPNSRVLEGTFEFPLLDGQRIVRFALDINGALREAVPVEKEKGRVVFEEIERRRVDPGLLEQTVGNNYRARIFPIPANGTRRIVIAYQEDLLAKTSGASNTNAAPRHRLALDFPNALKTFNLTAKVFSAPGAKKAKASTTLDLDLPAWREGNVLAVKKENFTARGVLEIELPASATSASGGSARPAVITETFNGREYFYAEVPVSLPSAAPKPRITPKCVGILWDASGSGRARDHEREFALLDAWFARVPNVDVTLVCVRDRASEPVKFRVSKGNWQELRAALEKTIYDGATSFDGLVDDAAVDEWMLFSDGLVNFGALQMIEKLPLRAPVHTVNASVSAAPALLRGLAARGGGEFVDLMSTEAKAAAYILRTEQLRIIAVERDPEAVAQVFPEVGTPFAAGREIVVTGILRKPSANVRIKVGLSGGSALATIDVLLKSGEGASTLAARAWAVTKIERLADAPGDNREDIRRTSREFRIVTADTSLIVLETLADYARYDIEPPAELREQWLAQRRATDDSFNKNREQHIAQVARMFEERMKWWKKEFSKGIQEKKEKSEAERLTAIRGERTRRGEVARPAPSQTAVAASRPASPPNAVLEDGTVAMERFEVTAQREGHAMATQSTVASGRLAVPAISADAFGGVSIGNTGEFLGNMPGVAVDSDSTVTIAGAPRAPKQSWNADSLAVPSGISLQRWSPSASYLDRLRRAQESERFSIYLEERADHAREPGFYLDVAGYFFDEAKDSATALQILSNLAELGLEDAALLRVLGHRLVQAGRPELAMPVFERVLKIRGEEPQSRRDLALVCAKLGQFQRAVDLLWEVVARSWDGRFPEIESIALGELNAIVATCGQKLDLSKIDTRLLKNLSVGLRVILTWDADNCDIDLWVDDPNGERCMYNHALTYQGGRMSRDFTGGYGPEEFLVRTPKPGKYTVRINYYGDRRQTALGPVTAQLRLITGFGTPQETEKLITVRLVDKKESLEIGSVEIGGEGGEVK